MLAPRRVLNVVACFVASVGSLLFLLWALGLPNARFEKTLPPSRDRDWERGTPSSAGCEIIQNADSVKIVIPGIPLKSFSSGGLGGLPATKSSFASSSSISLRIRQSGISEASQDLGGGNTNRPYSEAGIYLFDSSSEVTFCLRCRVVYYHETKMKMQQIQLERRTPKSSFQRIEMAIPAEEFVDLRIDIVGNELHASYSRSDEPKFVHVRSIEFAKHPDTWGVYAYSNTDSKTTFDFSDIVLTPNK